MREFAALMVLSALMIGVMGTPASAAFDYSPIGVPPSGGKNQAEILEDIYGQVFTASGLDFIGDSGVEAYRVYDFDDVYLKLHVVDGDQGDVDQIWTDGTTMVSAEAKYSAQGHPQTFGWNGGGTGTDYTVLLDDNTLSEIIPITGDFLWGYQPNSDQWWTLESLNTGGGDHMVTYKILGAHLYGFTQWLIFCENSPSSPEDWDYNDYVVEVTAIPEPATMMLLGLGGLALLRRRRA